MKFKKGCKICKRDIRMIWQKCLQDVIFYIIRKFSDVPDVLSEDSLFICESGMKVSASGLKYDVYIQILMSSSLYLNQAKFL